MATAWPFDAGRTYQRIGETIRNAEGETMRTLQSKGVAGVNDAVWDIRNAQGSAVSSGVYQFTVAAGSRQIATTVTVKP